MQKEHRDAPTAGHPSGFEDFEKVETDNYWKGMEGDALKFVMPPGE